MNRLSDGARCLRVGAALTLALSGLLTATLASALDRRGNSNTLQITTLSTKPELVSGGDVLVRIDVPSHVNPQRVRVELNNRDVSSDFRPDAAAHSLTGLVTGLRLGKNTLQASNANAGRAEQLTITNHLITGPIFSGPQQQPFVCETQTFPMPVIGGTLGPALDANCSIATRVDYVYKSTSGTFKALSNPPTLPADVAQITTNEGRGANYIVRVETGTINRAIYQIAILHDPTTESAPSFWSKPVAWNGRLIYSYGGGMAAGYHQGAPVNSINDAWLSLGYAVAVSTLNVFGNNNNDVLSAETTTMVKERFIERFGEPRYTIGWGSSGGSMQQHLIAHNYPGLLDGITPQSSFSDALLLGRTTSDCPLLVRAFDGATQAWTVEQKTAVAGWGTWDQCTTQLSNDWWRIFKAARSPLPTFAGCNAAVPASLIYDPATNPQGARCTYQDNNVNTFGVDPQTGFAPGILDNVGVQYGLAAFNVGKITAEQFVELNERAGGYDIDGNLIAGRAVADPEAVRTAYSTGRMNSGDAGLSIVPMIDFRTYRDDIADPHDSIRSHTTRARLIAANGNADNHAIIVGSRVGTGAGSAAAVQAEVLRLMDQWLANIKNDTSSAPLAYKVVLNRPPAVVDFCYTAEGVKITDQGACRQLYPPHGNARLVAGEPLTNDVLKCRLKPVSPLDYGQSLTNEQFVRLRTVFPAGVCDYSRPPVGKVPVKDTWLSYPKPGKSVPLQQDQ